MTTIPNSSPLADLTARELEILRLLADGQSNQEIAARLVLGLTTVKWYNRQIYSKLNVKNRREAARLLTAFDQPQFTLVRPARPVPLTPLVGRERELADLKHLLIESRTRLVTLFAPGGMGKTHLALAAAQTFMHHFAEGAAFTPLVAVAVSADIPTAIAAALGYPFVQDGRRPEQQISDYVQDKHLLLVLDNFEHLLDGMGWLCDLLAAAPNLYLLVTSREKLNAPGEVIYSLDSLDNDPARGLAGAAASLFVESAARNGSSVPEADAPAVIRICHMVGGMPLGILLAAAWTDTLTAAEIADEMARGLDILSGDTAAAPERHRSVRAAFEPSWRRLSPAEQQVIMRLSVCRGGCTRAAAEAVADAAPLDLRRLVSQSLLIHSADGRFTQHELLRQYTEEKLTAAGAADAARDAHAGYFLAWLAAQESDLKSENQPRAVAAINREFDNVRAAWLWAVRRGLDAALLAAIEALYLYGFAAYHSADRDELFRAAREAAAPAEGAAPSVLWWRLAARVPTNLEELNRALQAAVARDDRAEIAFCVMWYGVLLGDGEYHYAEAEAYLERSLVLYRALDDHFYICRTLNLLASWKIYQAHGPETMRLCREALAAARRSGIPKVLYGALYDLGTAQLAEGDYAGFDKCIQEVYRLALETNDRLEAAVAWGWYLPWTVMARGEFEAMRPMGEHLLAAAREVCSAHHEARALLTLAMGAVLSGRYTEARAWALESLRLFAGHPISDFCDWVLAALAVLDGAPHAAEQARTFLEHTTGNRYLIGVFMALPVSAGVLAQAGQLERAAEVLALAYTHPRSPTAMLERWPLAADLRAQLEAALGAARFAAAWQRGTAFDIYATAEVLSRPDEPPLTLYQGGQPA